MEIIRTNQDINLILNAETDFQTNLGWEENLVQYEEEALIDIINPIINYETIRYIHEPYSMFVDCNILESENLSQTDIWFYFYFISTGGTYVTDYNPTGLSYTENEHMLKQVTKSFFRLEFFKTPNITDINGNVIGYQPPTRTNRKLIFAKNLSLPNGEKYFYQPLNGYIHLPIFKGSNYEKKENMYFYWFEDESVLENSNLSGTTTGNTFFMTAKFYNAEDGSITDFTNTSYTSVYTNTIGINESNDMYYQIDIDKIYHTYKVYLYKGTKGKKVGTINNPVVFFERGGAMAPPSIPNLNCPQTPTPTPTRATILTTQTPTPTPTPTPTTVYYWLKMTRCDEDPSLNIYHYSKNAFLNNSIQRGDLFRGGSNGLPGSPPAGFFYYTVIDLLLTDPNGTIEGSKSVAPYALNCGQDPTHYRGATYRTAHMTIANVTGFTSVNDYKTNLCNKNIYQAYSYTGNTVYGVYFDVSVTGTTPTPGVAYNALYSGSTDGTPVTSLPIIANEGHYWAAALGTSNVFTHIVYIDHGLIGGWYDCATGNLIHYP
jgi:hypothetical protein